MKIRQGRTTNLKINLKTHYRQVTFISMKEERIKLSMTKKSCRVCWIRLVQSSHINRRHSAFYRVSLNSNKFKSMPYFWRTPSFWLTPPRPKFYRTTPSMPKFYGPTPPTNPRIRATHATQEPTLPTPPTLFSRLVDWIHLIT